MDNHPSTEKGHEKEETKQNELGAETTDTSLAWDDDNFQLEELDASKLTTAAGTGEASSVVVDDKDDWLKPREDLSSQASSNDIFLTTQFRDLNTPASKKKKRCANCTRPLLEENLSKLCNRCTK